MTRATMVVVVWLGACAAPSAPPPASAPPNTGATEATMATTATTATTPSAWAAPWAVQLSDGNANSWHFSGDGGEVTWRYAPVTPAESSSGDYSGGAAAAGTLTPAQAQALWAWAEAIDADVAHHIAARRMGTVAVRITRGAATQRRLVDGGDAVDSALAFCRGLAGSDAGRQAP